MWRNCESGAAINRVGTFGGFPRVAVGRILYLHSGSSRMLAGAKHSRWGPFMLSLILLFFPTNWRNFGAAYAPRYGTIRRLSGGAVPAPTWWIVLQMETERVSSWKYHMERDYMTEQFHGFVKVGDVNKLPGQECSPATYERLLMFVTFRLIACHT